MSFRGLDHVVVRVSDFEKAVATYRDTLGLELERVTESEAIGVKQAFFPLPEGGFIEVVAALGPETPVGRALERGGEGIHSLSMAVDDLAETVKELQEKGVALIGAEELVNGLVFIHPRATHGVLVQLKERE